MQLPGLILFDCDGVLVDSERLTVGVEARVLTELGWPVDAAEVVRRWMGRSSAVQMELISARLGTAAAALFDERTTREVDEAFDRELRPVPGVERLLDALEEAAAATCVASSGSHDRIARTLGHTGLLERFSGRIYSASEVARGKPAPDLFLHAARAEGVDPASCVVVEDSVYGIRAAVAAGMTAYGYAGGLTPAHELQAAGAVLVDEMSELVPLLIG